MLHGALDIEVAYSPAINIGMPTVYEDQLTSAEKHASVSQDIIIKADDNYSMIPCS